MCYFCVDVHVPRAITSELSGHAKHRVSPARNSEVPPLDGIIPAIRVVPLSKGISEGILIRDAKQEAALEITLIYREVTIDLT